MSQETRFAYAFIGSLVIIVAMGVGMLSLSRLAQAAQHGTGAEALFYLMAVALSVGCYILGMAAVNTAIDPETM